MVSTDKRNSKIGTAIFSGTMLMAALLFTMLGFWQMERKAWKEELIASSEARANAAPVAVSELGEWDSLDVEAIDFQPVTMTGQFLDQAQARVFISLPKKLNRQSGPGYWIVTPFQLKAGGIVYVNRGFVPQEIAFTDDYAAPPSDEMTISGVLRRPERAGSATLEPDLSKNVDWIINPERISTVLFPEMNNVAPFYVIWQPEQTIALPQPALLGEVELPNRHLEYALTWFALAILTPILLIFWLWRRKRASELATNDTQH